MVLSEDQEILDDGDVAALGFSTRRGGDRDRKKSHAQLKAAGKKSRLDELGGDDLGSGNDQAASAGDEEALARMGRTDATRVLAGFLQVLANTTCRAPVLRTRNPKPETPCPMPHAPTLNSQPPTPNPQPCACRCLPTCRAPSRSSRVLS